MSDDDPYDDQDEGGGCPFCGGTTECRHNVTTLDLTFPHALGLCRAAVEPMEPLGCGGAGAVATAIFDLLRRFLLRKPKWTEEEVREACDLPPTLLSVVLAEYATAEYYPSTDGVDNGEYAAFTEWKQYVEEVLVAAGAVPAEEGFVAGGPGTTSMYDTWWAKDGDDAVGAANGRFHADAERIRAIAAALETAGSAG